jgi:hypothetical protein
MGGGSRLADLVVIPEGDQTQNTIAQRQQIMENATMLQGLEVPVAATDNHWVHMQALKAPLIQAINAQMLQPAMAGLKHYTAHWTAGVAEKVLPSEAINAEKSFIADAEKAIMQLQQQEQAAQMQAGGGQPPAGVPPMQ